MIALRPKEKSGGSANPGYFREAVLRRCNSVLFFQLDDPYMGVPL